MAGIDLFLPKKRKGKHGFESRNMIMIMFVIQIKKRRRMSGKQDEDASSGGITDYASLVFPERTRNLSLHPKFRSRVMQRRRLIAPFCYCEIFIFGKKKGIDRGIAGSERCSS